MTRTVAVGLVGTTMDAGKWASRWERWRPTVALCQQAGLPIDRLELIHDNHATALAERLVRDIAEVSPATECRRHLVNFRNPWDFEEVYAGLHDFARGYTFDPAAESYLVNITTGTHVAQICWFLLVEAHYIPGRLLQLSPPRPGEPATGRHSIIDLDLSRYDRIARRFRTEHDEGSSFLKSGIATRNAAFNRMIEQIETIAIRTRAPLLLTGPTGAGKSQLARRIFELKRARHQVSGPFVEVNCATLRGEHAMAALFGHVRGAFTGAVAARAGLLRTADRGILFLDEIGELGLDEQAMILRAVEDKRFLPVGSDKEAASDFQLVAGTNCDLAGSVAAGRFREDLLARLNLWTFALPGLADRREDIEPNIEFELARQAEPGGRLATFNREARTRYLAFAVSSEASWAANFRDLGASLTRMATLAPGGRIDGATVEDEIARLKVLWHRDGGDADARVLDQVLAPDRLAELDPFDRVQLAHVVRTCRSSASLSAAGRRLFAASRQKKASGNDADRLRKYLARFGLDWTGIVGAG